MATKRANATVRHRPLRTIAAVLNVSDFTKYYGSGSFQPLFHGEKQTRRWSIKGGARVYTLSNNARRLGKDDQVPSKTCSQRRRFAR